MKDNVKKVTKAEDVKEEAKTEEEGAEVTDEELLKVVTAGTGIRYNVLGEIVK